MFSKVCVSMPLASCVRCKILIKSYIPLCPGRVFHDRGKAAGNESSQSTIKASERIWGNLFSSSVRTSENCLAASSRNWFWSLITLGSLPV